jgi:rod shape-determining protein MreC
VLIVLLVVAIALITIDFKGGGKSQPHSLGARLFGPVEHVAGDLTSPFVAIYHALSGNDQAEISALQQQNDQLRTQLAASQVSQQEQAQLASLLHLAANGRYRVVTGTVIAAGGSYDDTVTIGVGSSAGVAPDETVLNGDGLVGTVLAVTPDTATVQLATDAAATVGVRMAGSGKIGALTGTATSMAGRGQLKLTLFDATATLLPGQEVVTFGSVGGRPYVPGVPVGRIVEVTSQPGSLTPTALVQPFADFTGLGVLGVVISK